MMGAALPNGWHMQRIAVDERGYDQNGWRWRADTPTWWLTDGVDSLTIVARSPVEALWLAMRDGWPPRRLHRYQQP